MANVMNKMMGLGALNIALNELLATDEKVLCIGEDIGDAGGCWKYFSGLKAKFGTNRILQMPIAEAGYTQVANGLAYGGYRPIVEYMFADFATLAADGIINVAAKARYNSAGALNLPITFLFPQGTGQAGCQHSQTVEAWFANIPGLKLVAPTTPNDMRYFLKAAVRDDDPVCFFFSRPCAMGAVTEDIDLDDQQIPALTNAAKIVKEGKDLTIVAWHLSLLKTLKVVGDIEKETGKTIEVIDPRVLVPFDKETVFASVKKTGKVIIANDECERGSFSSHIATWIAEECLTDLKAPIKRIGAYNTCIPFGAVEEYSLPTEDDIKAAIMSLI